MVLIALRRAIERFLMISSVLFSAANRGSPVQSPKSNHSNWNTSDLFLKFSGRAITFPVAIHQNMDSSYGSIENNGYYVEGSRLLTAYPGPKEEHLGFSTEPGVVGLLQTRDWETPLSTCGAGNCAIAIFYDDASRKHALIHAFALNDNVKLRYKNDILQKMPSHFNRVVFIPGRDPLTIHSVNSFLKTILEVNPNVSLEFRHFPANGLEVVSYQGQAYFIPGEPGGLQATFRVQDDSRR